MSGHSATVLTERLAQFSLEHPLILRTRSRLARAIVHRIHLGASVPDRLKHSKELLEAVLDPQVKILISGNASSSIHAWSVDGTYGGYRDYPL